MSYSTPKDALLPPLYPNDHSYMLYCDPIVSEIISELVDDDEICVSEGEYHHELTKCWSKVVEKKKNENSLRKSALFLFIPIRPLKTYSYPPLYPNDHSYMMYYNFSGSGIISELIDDDEICVSKGQCHHELKISLSMFFFSHNDNIFFGTFNLRNF